MRQLACQVNGEPNGERRPSPRDDAGGSRTGALAAVPGDHRWPVGSPGPGGWMSRGDATSSLV